MSTSMMMSTLFYVGVVGYGLVYFLKRREFLAPETLTSASFLVTVPYFLFISLYPEESSGVNSLSQRTYESTFPIVVCIEALLYLTVILGILIGRWFIKPYGYGSRRLVNSRAIARSVGSNIPSLVSGLVLLVVGFGLILSLVIDKGGGVVALWQRINMRTIILVGSGDLYIVATFLVQVGMGIVFLQTFCQKRRYWVFAMSLGLAIFSLGVMGARTPVIGLVLMLVVLYHYYVSPLRFSGKLVAKFIFLGFLFLLFIAAVAAARRLSMSGDELGSQDAGILYAVKETLSHLSHINTYVFIFDYFSFENIWLGSSYINLYSFVESFLTGSEKVPLDDGVYVTALVLSGSVDPNELSKNLFLSSLPPNLWFGFMQFHFFGLFFCALFMGWVRGWAYGIFMSSGRSLYAFFFLYQVGYNFQLTNYWIVKCAINAVLIYLVYCTLRIIKQTRSKKRFYCPSSAAIK